MMFKPRRLTDSLLLYNAFTNDGNGDYISISLRDEYVEFRYDSGTGIAESWIARFLSFYNLQSFILKAYDWYTVRKSNLGPFH